MKSNFRLRSLTRPILVAAIASAGTAAQAAQVALPTAPAADRASIGGYTAARASLPGDNGSPLEPYLYLAILAGGGIIAAVGVVASDRRIRGAR
jgi:hypothetical protein